jgi:lincosamide nucleotidyltransferase A/C/D/E
MDASTVRSLVRLLDQAGVPVWLDGGWGVDALLGRQTRAHHDLDIIIRVSDVPALLAACESTGFGFRDGSVPHSFVLANSAALELDVHSVTFREDGTAVHRMADGNDWVFSSTAFLATGIVDGTVVKCLSPDTQVRCHAQGYSPTEKDFQDMGQLQEAFGVNLPPSLERRTSKHNDAG